MKKLEETLANIKTGNHFVVKKDNENKIYGAELRYDGDIPMDMVLVNIDKFVKEFPNLIKQLTCDNIYRLTYDMHNKKFISIIADKDNRIIINASSNDLYESILELENVYTSCFGKIVRKIKTKLNKVS